MKKSNIVLLIALGALLALLLAFTITAGSAVRRAVEEGGDRSSAVFDPADQRPVSSTRTFPVEL